MNRTGTAPLVSRHLLPAFLLLAVLALCGGQEAAAQERAGQVLVAGTGTALGGMHLLAEAYSRQRPDLTIDVLPSLGSNGSIKALLAGRIDIALSARPLMESETAGAVEVREYARTPIVFVVGEDNPLNAITLEDAVAIYSGTRTKWADGEPIRLILRPETEGDIQLLKDISPQMRAAVEAALARSELHVTMNDQDNADVLEKVSGAIGVTTLAQIRAEGRRLKPLALNGVEGSVEAIGSGIYPHAKPLYLVTRADISEQAAGFVAFIASAQGRDILRSSGHLPVEDEPRG